MLTRQCIEYQKATEWKTVWCVHRTQTSSMVYLSPFSDGLSALRSHHHMASTRSQQKTCTLFQVWNEFIQSRGDSVFWFILKTVSPKYNLSIINYIYLNHKAWYVLTYVQSHKTVNRSKIVNTSNISWIPFFLNPLPDSSPYPHSRQPIIYLLSHPVSWIFWKLICK